MAGLLANAARVPDVERITGHSPRTMARLLHELYSKMGADGWKAAVRQAPGPRAGDEVPAGLRAVVQDPSSEPTVALIRRAPIDSSISLPLDIPTLLREGLWVRRRSTVGDTPRARSHPRPATVSPRL